MEIRFNPLIAAEADAVRRFLTPGDVQARVENIINKLTPDEAVAELRTQIAQHIAEDDRPDVGADVAALAASAIPLPPSVPSAPSTVAADLFPTAPAVPQAGIPLPPGAALPPVPPVPAAPPAPPAPAAPTNRADVDSAGLPWDARIHSESRNKVADGTWRKRRNTAPELVAQVEGELRALMAIPAPGAAIPAPPAPVTAVPAGPGATAIIIDPSASPASPVTPPVPAPPVPQPPAVAPTPVAPPPVAQDTAVAPAEPVTFAGVMRQVTEGLTQHKFTEQTVNECLREAAGGVDIKIGMLAARPDLCATFSNLLRAKSAA